MLLKLNLRPGETIESFAKDIRNGDEKKKFDETLLGIEKEEQVVRLATIKPQSQKTNLLF